MIVEGELERVDVVIFADTGDEPGYVYEYVKYLQGRLETVDIPLVIVNNGNLIEDIYRHGRFAAMPLFTKQLISIEGFGVKASREQIGRLKRQCTSDYKIAPIERWIRKELLRTGHARQNKNGAILINKGVMVESWLGISFDELERIKPNKNAWIDNRWPLIDLRMKRSDCVKWLESRGLPVPNKSSCRKCPFHTVPYWRNMRDNQPDDWESTLQFDRDLRNGTIRLGATAKGDVFFTEDCIPLDLVDLSTKQEKGQRAFDICDEGYCGI